MSRSAKSNLVKLLRFCVTSTISEILKIFKLRINSVKLVSFPISFGKTLKLLDSGHVFAQLGLL